jgi:cadmium resistance protein CadD (predicted permease)
MTDLFSLVGIEISAFVATNIDDVFVLMLFFSSNFQKSHIVIGQYLGIGLLVAISTLGSLLALVVPQYIIGLLGLVPIAIGVIRLVQLRKHDKGNK